MGAVVMVLAVLLVGAALVTLPGGEFVFGKALIVGLAAYLIANVAKGIGHASGSAARPFFLLARAKDFVRAVGRRKKYRRAAASSNMRFRLP